MGEIKRINLGGEQEKVPAGIRRKQVLTVKREDLFDFIKFLVPRLPANAVTLKGGFVLGELTGAPRYTADIDMSLLGAVPYDNLKPILVQYGELLKREGKCCQYEVVPDVIPGRRSGGVTYYGSTPQDLLFSVDISESECAFDTITINMAGVGSVVVTSVEQVMSDKLTVLFSKKRFRRVKDVIDIYTILNTCSVDWAKVIECLARRDNWPLPADKYPFTEERLEQLEHAYDKYVLQDIDGNVVEHKTPFKEVVQKIASAIWPLINTEVLE